MTEPPDGGSVMMFAAAPRCQLLMLARWLLFGSGLLALVFETLWVRQLTSILGATTPAIAATVSAYLLGLGAGSAAFGRVRRPASFRRYAALEAAVAISVLLSQWLLSADVARFATGSQGLDFLIAVAVVFAPAFFMGGTIPVLLGPSGASGLYAMNTLGAAIGALSVPFFWLPRFGIAHSFWIGAAGNLLLALVAWIAARPAVVAAPPPATAASESRPRLALLAFASGLFLFVLEIAWSRGLAQVHASSLAAFAVVLASFLLALGLASFVVARGTRRGISIDAWLRWAWGLGGLAVFASPRMLFAATDGLRPLAADSLLGLAACALPVVALPAVFGGLALPALLDAVRGNARQCGALLAVNTAGSVLGLLLGAFVVPRWLGTWNGIGAIGLAMMAAALVVTSAGWRWRIVLPLLAFAVHPFALPITRLEPGERLIVGLEGSHGLVAVVERSQSRRLKLDNSYVIGGTGSIGDERIQSHIPLLLHPSPRAVAYLGLGTGITAGAARLHPVERVVIAELVPEVAIAAQQEFAEANLDIARRAEIALEDGRRLLARTPAAYDVVIGDLVVPWRRGEAALYTAEQFASARRALRAGGLYCQWVPAFQLSADELDMLIATFVDVFPGATLWRGDFAPDRPALALVGWNAPGPPNADVVQRRLGELRPDVANPHLVHPAGVWIYFIGGLDGRAAELATTKRNRADRPWLELAGAERHPLTGAALEDVLDRIRRTDSVASGDVAAWRDAGAEIARATIADAAGRSAERDRALARAADRLPPAVRQMVIGR